MSTSPSAVLRFARFELDPRSGELGKKGDLVPLRPQAVVETKFEEVPYIGALKALVPKMNPRLREFMTAAQTLIEERPAESLEAVNRIVSSDFRDPERLFYLTRHLARLGDTAGALQLLERVAAGGFACYPAFADDPFLSSLGTRPAFKTMLGDTRRRHQVAANAFAAASGGRLLGMEV